MNPHFVLFDIKIHSDSELLTLHFIVHSIFPYFSL